MLGDLRDQASAALEDLRDLARASTRRCSRTKGLFPAVEAQARKAAVPVTVQLGELGRYPPAIESTVYFCVLEALTNVVKYANASGAVISLAQTDGVLTFEVQDDGRGFDSTGSTYGTGLQGMADRLDAVGGGLVVRSSPGTGAWSAARSRCRRAMRSRSSPPRPRSRHPRSRHRERPSTTW